MSDANDQLPAAPASSASSWAERAADRSPSVQRSRERSLQRAQQIVQARPAAGRGQGLGFHYTGFGERSRHRRPDLLQAFPGQGPGDPGGHRGHGRGNLRRPRPGKAESCRDPVARIRFYVTSIISGIAAYGEGDARPRFITTEHWRLHRLYPDELARANRPFTGSAAAGDPLRPPRPARSPRSIRNMTPG